MKKLVTVATVLAAFALGAGECGIEVDFALSAGVVKPMHGVGQPPLLGHDNTSMFHYLKEAGVPYSRLHDVGGAFARNVLVDIPNLFRDFDADENDPANYDFAFTDILVNELVKNGVEPYFRLGVTIENSRKVKAYRIHPPKDFAKWARICEHVVRHYTEGWANGFRHKITYWEIWNEPENQDKPELNQMWTGTWNEFCRFYETSAKYLKKKFPALKIGGYGSCGFYAAVPGKNVGPRYAYMVDCFTNFLAYVKRTDAPLDFFSFHAYSKPKDAVLQTEWAIKTLRAYGFGNVETSLNEWHPGGGIDKLGSSGQAAEICAEMIGLQNTELDNAMLYDARCGVGVYSPLFNPLTQKPHKAYYALKAFNEIYKMKNAVKAASDDDDVWVLAACDGDKAKMLVVNTSGEEKKVSWRLQGRMATTAILVDKTHDYEKVEFGNVLPPESFALLDLVSNEQIAERHIAYPAKVTSMPQLRGLMLPSADCTEDDFRTLHEWGATIVRYQMTGAKKTWGGLSPDRDVAKIIELYGKWLDGRLDHLEKVVLPMAKKYGMKVCVDLHDAPGYRYQKSVGDVPPGRANEFRMYYMEEYRNAFYDSWRKIASRFKGDPSIYGFDLINEPAQNGDVPVGFWAIQEKAAKIIREIDPATTIIVEGDHMDNPDSFKTLKPIGLDNVIYQVHMYMPFLFTHQAVAIDHDWKVRASYPDAARGWDKMHLRECLRHVRAFEKRHGARIYVGEFSATTWAKGADAYLRDCIEIFNEYGWDWSYHAFREWSAWSVEHEWPDRFNTKPVQSKDNPRMRVLKNGLKERPVPELCHFDHLEDELLALIHFGPNTFTGVGWGFGDTPPSVFDPKKLDADQWIRAIAAGGIRRVILVAKHHDGFCLWQSRLNDSYSVKNAPWRDGKGDLVREVSDACRRRGLSFGIYLSPWDRNRADYAKAGYPEYYRGQMDELLTNYGPISELWFDGARVDEGWYGGTKERRKIKGDAWKYYGIDSIVARMHELYPRAGAFSARCEHSFSGSGNEQGIAMEDLNSMESGGVFRSVECDTPLRMEWFWREMDSPKSLAHLVETYFRSVGRGAVLNLGIAPNKEGLVGDDDAARLKEFGDWVKRFNATDLSADAKKVERSGKAISIALAKPTKINCFDLKEDIYHGQNIAAWIGEARVGGTWKRVCEGATVGFRRIERFDEVVADAVRVKIVKGKEHAAWAGFAVRYAPKVPVSKPVDLGWRPIHGRYVGCLDKTAAPDEWIWRFKTPVRLNFVLYRPFFNDSVPVDKYEIYSSEDGENWTLVKAGEFGNVVANPVAQFIKFDKIYDFKNLKVKAVHAVGDVPPKWNHKNKGTVGFGIREVL